MADIATLAVATDTRQLTQLNRELGRTRTQAGQTERQVDQLGGGFGRLGRTAAALPSLLRGMASGFASVGASIAVRAIIQQADAYTQLRSQLRLVTDGNEELAASLQAVRNVSRETRVAVEGTGQLYARFARSVAALRDDQERLESVTRATNQAVAISGTTAAAANAALFQLGQGLAADALRGQELNSVMEQTPRLAQAIADGLGVPIGKLRELAEAGELTAERVIRAIESQSAVLNREFAQVEVTVGSATQVLTDSLGAAIDRLNQATGATNLLAQAILGVADAIDSIPDRDRFIGLSGTFTFGGVELSLNEFLALPIQLQRTIQQIAVAQAEADALAAGIAGGTIVEGRVPPRRPNVIPLGASLAEARQSDARGPGIVPTLLPETARADNARIQAAEERLRIEEQIAETAKQAAEDAIQFGRDTAVAAQLSAANARQTGSRAGSTAFGPPTPDVLTAGGVDRLAGSIDPQIAAVQQLTAVYEQLNLARQAGLLTEDEALRLGELSREQARARVESQTAEFQALNQVTGALGQAATSALLYGASFEDVSKRILAGLIAQAIQYAITAAAAWTLRAAMGDPTAAAGAVGNPGAGAGGLGGVAAGGGLLSRVPVVGGLLGGLFGGQHGLNLVVPGGGQADTRILPLRVSGGEHVSVRQAGDRRSAGGDGASFVFSPRIDARGNNVNVLEVARLQREQFRDFKRRLRDERIRDPEAMSDTSRAA